ncbi:MAG: hypothetical protein JWQ09_1985 [Segetibacter sp.]|nr:hypothetical protein [Segetibacter sp.]
MVGFVLICIAFICFYDVLALGFFSDDYYVLHRLTILKQFWAPGFFRPLSDISLLFNYYINGYNAFGYRLFNVILHGINAFILYKTLLKVYELEDNMKFYASFIAAILFVTYPFHSESIIWIVGRASLVGNTFGILCLYFFFSELSYSKKMALVCACYFIGLTSYESVLVVPGIIFFAVWHRKSLKDAFLFVIPLAITLIAHIIVRWFVSGVLAGRYGGDIFNEGQRNYASKFLKSFGRLFLPGLHDSQLLTVLFICVIVLIAFSFFILRRYHKKHLHFYILMWIFLLVSHILPTMFGVDSHTSDGDRLLYFPSFFLCAIVAFLICVFSKYKLTTWAVTLVLFTANLFLLKQGNKNWIKADAAMTDIFTKLKNNCCDKPVYFINIPDAIEGSFVFRNGFYEALAIHQIPSANISVVNFLLNKHAILQADTIVPKMVNPGIYSIPPFVTVNEQAFIVDSLAHGFVYSRKIKRKPNAVILFWNRTKVVSLLP